MGLVPVVGAGRLVGGTLTARYLLCPGPVRSRADGDLHYVGAAQLAALYRVHLADCVTLPAAEPGALGGGRAHRDLLAHADSGDLIALWPRHDGDYRLPEPRP